MRIKVVRNGVIMDGLQIKWHYIQHKKLTWNKLQKIKGHEHNCGRPGVNGGYIKNKNVKFGVNCFAPKPKITEEEQTLMDSATPYPLTPDEIKVNELTHKYKKNLHSILLSPFNYEKWAQ